MVRTGDNRVSGGKATRKGVNRANQPIASTSNVGTNTRNVADTRTPDITCDSNRESGTEDQTAVAGPSTVSSDWAEATTSQAASTIDTSGNDDQEENDPNSQVLLSCSSSALSRAGDNLSQWSESSKWLPSRAPGEESFICSSIPTSESNSEDIDPNIPPAEFSPDSTNDPNQSYEKSESIQTDQSEFSSATISTGALNTPTDESDEQKMDDTIHEPELNVTTNNDNSDQGSPITVSSTKTSSGEDERGTAENPLDATVVLSSTSDVGSQGSNPDVITIIDSPDSPSNITNVGTNTDDLNAERNTEQRLITKKSVPIDKATAKRMAEVEEELEEAGKRRSKRHRK